MLTDEERRERLRAKKRAYAQSPEGRAARARASAAYRRRPDRIAWARVRDRLKWLKRQVRAGRLFCDLMRNYRRYRGFRHGAMPASSSAADRTQKAKPPSPVRYIKPSRMAEARALLERLRAEREISRRRAQA